MINHLAYAPDGHFLVATLGRTNGIRIYRTADYALETEDRQYGDESYSASFDRTGRLATTSLDGLIRLYDRDFRLLAKRNAPGGNQPYSVSFSPDGSKVTIGLSDTLRVDVLSGSDLSPLYSPNTKGMGYGSLSAVSWSADGRFLYAGKGLRGPFVIRKWADAGRGRYTDLPAADSSIMGILPLNAGGIAFGAADPAFGVFDADDHRTVYQPPPIADHRGLLQRFLISHDGTIRWYRLEDGKELLASFPHRDGERWVLWTPEGFFDASAGGETLIGYHLNRGRGHAADFVGVEQLYNLFYRPDLVAKRLQGGYEAEILAQLRKIGDVQAVLAKGLPPIVEFLAPPRIAHDRRDFTLDLKLTDQGGGIGRIVYRINGVAVQTPEGARPVDISPPGGPRQAKVHRPITLQPGQNTVIVTAYNGKNEIESRAASITVDVPEQLAEIPALYVLLIGIDSYRDNALKLSYAVSDAKAMARELPRRGSELFRSIHSQPLINGQATRQGIETAFKEVVTGMKRSDVFVLYLAGHGMAVDGEYYKRARDLRSDEEPGIRAIVEFDLRHLQAEQPQLADRIAQYRDTFLRTKGK